MYRCVPFEEQKLHVPYGITVDTSHGYDSHGNSVQKRALAQTIVVLKSVKYIFGLKQCSTYYLKQESVDQIPIVERIIDYDFQKRQITPT